ncbi:MAG: hypothetical protein HRU02_15750 [Myxococcales bacterium]|nr:hypothetical protein [Myxococcales bacterium]
MKPENKYTLHWLLIAAAALLIADMARAETPPEDHWRRAGLACQTPTAWKTEYQVGRKSPIKPWPFECTHALRNVWIEWLRREGWYNRGDRGPAPDPEYLFPEG